eukprot:CAMPEP_0202864734 /NCGR_PEP_ID=MMETSP1391-20130828/4843_1 /ASSEMBLY_ACC=CAM_ASM_000867 /TAXON_ID=1034604 /ORGANISM="Chlamydomonas leiostraca, Strain SAG 11-49" /LENGTH=165 /DNA_ID=CAMNT_0049544503 /DNA_START=491 /DNA_END=988 /DNA_ORIENTATION=+
MENRDQVDAHAAPTLCGNGCGFYSNGLHGLCSKCFREKQADQQQKQAASTAVAQALTPPAPSQPAPAPQPAPSQPAAVPEPAPTQPEASSSAAPAPSKPSPTRCLMCNKKVGLTGFQCKCNPDAVFCGAHRYAEAHCCTFDYKTAQRQQLAANNPLVQASKLEKI